ncbi:hypothetical protein RJG79_08360 [Mycoplasmatota bacterium WC44]
MEEIKVLEYIFGEFKYIYTLLSEEEKDKLLKCFEGKYDAIKSFMESHLYNFSSIILNHDYYSTMISLSSNNKDAFFRKSEKFKNIKSNMGSELKPIEDYLDNVLNSNIDRDLSIEELADIDNELSDKAYSFLLDNIKTGSKIAGEFKNFLVLAVQERYELLVRLNESKLYHVPKDENESILLYNFIQNYIDFKGLNCDESSIRKLFARMIKNITNNKLDAYKHKDKYKIMSKYDNILMNILDLYENRGIVGEDNNFLNNYISKNEKITNRMIFDFIKDLKGDMEEVDINFDVLVNADLNYIERYMNYKINENLKHIRPIFRREKNTTSNIRALSERKLAERATILMLTEMMKDGHDFLNDGEMKSIRDRYFKYYGSKVINEKPYEFLMLFTNTSVSNRIRHFISHFEEADDKEFLDSEVMEGSNNFKKSVKLDNLFDYIFNNIEKN